MKGLNKSPVSPSQRGGQGFESPSLHSTRFACSWQAIRRASLAHGRPFDARWRGTPHGKPFMPDDLVAYGELLWATNDPEEALADEGHLLEIFGS